MVLLAYIADLIFGDPSCLIEKISHPVIVIGNLITKMEKKLLIREDSIQKQRINGALLTLIVMSLTGGAVFSFLVILYKFNFYLGFVIETFICYQVLAIKSLENESMRVYFAKNLCDLRKNLSYIVGRDTQNLSEKEIYKATVETIAENTTDGVVAPMMYMFLGGATLGIIYKSVNTLDSMVGYMNEKYRYFGTFSAKLDDVLNFIPARMAAIFMILASYILKFNCKKAFEIWIRDRRNHKSPNSAQTESVCAGALDIMLAGDATYFGEIVKKPTIGDDNRLISREDIKNANKLMYITSAVAIIVFTLIKGVFMWWLL